MSPDLKLEEVRRASGDGADEIDMVIDRGLFLTGEYNRVFDEIAATKEACVSAHLQVILETGELQTYNNVRLASEIAMRAGERFFQAVLDPWMQYSCTYLLICYAGEADVSPAASGVGRVAPPRRFCPSSSSNSIWICWISKSRLYCLRRR